MGGIGRARQERTREKGSAKRRTLRRRHGICRETKEKNEKEGERENGGKGRRVRVARQSKRCEGRDAKIRNEHEVRGEGQTGWKERSRERQKNGQFLTDERRTRGRRE